MTLMDLITQALQAGNIFRPSENIPAEDIQDAVNNLNIMIDSWNIGTVYASTRESKTLTAGTGSYTWGSGGDINTARPVKFLDAYVVDGNHSYPIRQIGEKEYDALSEKTDQGRPSDIFYHNTYPLVTIYLSLVPEKAYTLWLISEKDLADFSATDLTSTIALPGEYMEPLVANLAIRRCIAYEKEPPPMMVKIADDSLRLLKRLIASNKLKPVTLNLFPSDKLGGFWKAGDIQSGGII